MSITTHLDKTIDLTVFTITGVLAFDEVMSTVKDFYDGDPTKHVLWDLLEVTENLIPLEQAEKIVTFQPRFEGKRELGKTAIVAQDQFLYGISNVLGTQNNLLETSSTVMEGVQNFVSVQ